MKISVIIPIYNAEQYLRKCIDSVLKQTYKEFELILVDDGSSDSSGRICDEFAGGDGRIKVIHKENGGLICARITGIKMAEYDVVAFVDADDWIDSCFLECLADKMQAAEADIVISGCVRETKEGSIDEVNIIRPGIYGRRGLEEEFYPKMLYFDGFYRFGVLPYMWNKLFRKKLLEKCYTDIDTNIYDGEDAAVVYPYLLLANRAAVIEDCRYHYRIHENSMSFSKGKNFYENVSRLYLHLDKMFRKSRHYGTMLPQLNQYMRMMVWTGIPEKMRIKEQYCFPFGKVSYGSDIVLYGAGYIGIIYYEQIKKTKYCNVVLWADRDYLHLSRLGMPVGAVAEISGKKFDYIVVANLNAETREEIAANLVSMGIRKEQIIMGEE